MSERGSHDGDWIFDPSVAAMARELRRELRHEAQEVEASVASAELRGRTFSDVALEARNQGAVVTVAMQRRSFQGLVRFAGRDYLTIHSPTLEVDVNIEAIDYLRPVEGGGHAAGRAIEEAAGSFELRLMERESPVERVELGFRFREDILLGHLATVGQDHVILIDDQRANWVIPTRSVAFVIRRQQKTGRR